jgi:uncharacterized protein YbjT (DUF2867 family)
MNRSDKTILVTGATGRQGGAVTRHLLDAGWHVRVISRDPGAAKARPLRELGLELMRGDLTDARSLPRALEGVYGVFGVGTPYEFGVENEVEQGVTLGDAAAAAGVEHFIYSSVGGAERHTGIPHFGGKSHVEEHLRRRGLPLTVVRPVFFMENLLGWSTARSERGLSITMPLDERTRLQMIAVDDIGGIVATMFGDPQRFIGGAWELAGDQLTMPQAAAELGQALSEPVGYERTSYDDVRRSSEDAALMYEWFDRAGYQADIAAVRGIYADLHDFAAWARETAAGALRHAA